MFQKYNFFLQKTKLNVSIYPKDQNLKLKFQ